MKKSTFFTVGFIALCLVVACGGNTSQQQNQQPKAEVEEATAPPAQPTGANIHEFLKDGPKGVGPITAFTHKPFDQAMADEGNQLFITKCSMCHRLETKLLGPPLLGVTKKRTPEWILNMMLTPEKMLEEDADAKALLAEYQTPMTNMGLSEPQALAVLEYLRQEDAR